MCPWSMPPRWRLLLHTDLRGRMQLKQLVQHLKALSVDGSLETQVAGISYDSPRITPGMVFVAIPGHNTDGHEFIGTALERGASAIVCERNGIVPSRATRIRSESPQAWSSWRFPVTIPTAMNLSAPRWNAGLRPSSVNATG